jgi:hypothetical protein
MSGKVIQVIRINHATSLCRLNISHRPAKANSVKAAHRLSATARDKAVSTSVRLIAVLDILSKYADTR